MQKLIKPRKFYFLERCVPVQGTYTILRLANHEMRKNHIVSLSFKLIISFVNMTLAGTVVPGNRNSCKWHAIIKKQYDIGKDRPSCETKT